MVPNQPDKPSREPDLVILYYNVNVCFWWAEKIQTNGYDTYHFDPDNWTWLDPVWLVWRKYEKNGFYRQNIEQIHSSYAQWLLEREIS